MEEQKQYYEELLEWCNNIYSNWESMKLRFSKPQMVGCFYFIEIKKTTQVIE